jgi:transcriptional regulator with XRE-family HTH domain
VADRRSELGAFLKSRRARIRPEDVGLPPGPRRRTPGLRREEVAQLSGVGITWYTWLEQGRRINVSVQVLEAVARTLALDAAEKSHLYRLADIPTVPSPHEDNALPPELQTILDHLAPLPATVLSAKYDVIATNEPYRALFPGSALGKNVLWTIFTTPSCCNSYKYRPDDLALMVGYLRGAYGRNLEDPAWGDFIDRLCEKSGQFAELWARNDVAVPANRTRLVNNLAVGEMEMYMTSMSLPSIAGAWVQIFTPIDESTWTRLNRLLAMAPEAQTAPLLEHRERYHRNDVESLELVPTV